FVLKSRWSRHIRNLLIVIAGISVLAAVTHSYELWPFNNWALAQQFSFYSLWTRSWEFLIGGIIALTPLGVSRTLSTRPMMWIGDRSYSLYLWHWPVIVFLNRQFPELRYFSSVAILLSFVLAALSYSLIEQSWRHRIRFSRRAATVLVAGFLVLPTIGASRLLSNDLERRQPVVESSGGVLDTKELSKCWPTNEIEGTRFDFAYCLSDEPTTRDRILLVGDSQAGSLIYALDDIAQALGAEPNVASKPGCPLSPSEDAIYLYNFSDQNLMTRDNCRQVLSDIQTWSHLNKPKFTIAAIHSPFYVGSPGLTKSFELRLFCFLANDNTCDRSSSPKERVEQYRPMLEKSLRFLSESSDHVILIAPIPGQYRDQVDLEGDEFGRGTPRAAVDAVREPILSLYDSLRNEFPNLVIWDPISQLCTETFCPSEDLQGGLYSDNTHLSIHGASLLTTPLIDLLKSLR
ncbi:MAG: acyltransferase, partial [Actinobacteria bacterium]|nr:acyltransferase [Actinomycetota bacterium]